MLAKLEQAPYAARFKEVFGQNIFADPHKAFAQAMYAIERFELEDPSFHPYTSKFDYYLDGKVQLTAQELRGKKLFDDPAGAIAPPATSIKRVSTALIRSSPTTTSRRSACRAIRSCRANADPNYFDMGLCGPLRNDQASDKSNCGLFKTPSLRNTATRQVFFHNGRFHTLEGRVALLRPARYESGQAGIRQTRHGKVDKFNDLPVAMRINVDTFDAPLTAKRGERPVWSERDIDDVAAFLATLNDDYPYKATPVK